MRNFQAGTWGRCVCVVWLWGLSACQQGFTAAEARQAVDESSISAQASALMASSVEISTDFTIGEAVQIAAMEIRDTVAANLPCAEITVDDAVVHIEYGAHPQKNCVHNGRTLSGVHTVHVAANDEAEVLVEHTWEDLDNGLMSVSGEADVTWSLADRTRHVVHELTWTRLRDGRTGTGRGDRLQAALDGTLSEGITVDGDRSWDGKSGHWSLDIDQVEARWRDPVPQAGSYTLDTPFDKSLTLSFERVDAARIRVNAEGPKRSFDFTVTALGLIED